MKRRTLLAAGGLLPFLGTPLARAQDSGKPYTRGKGISSRGAMHNGRATLFIDGAPVYPMIYSLTDTPQILFPYDLSCLFSGIVQFIPLPLETARRALEISRFAVKGTFSTDIISHLNFGGRQRLKFN